MSSYNNHQGRSTNHGGGSSQSSGTSRGPVPRTEVKPAKTRSCITFGQDTLLEKALDRSTGGKTENHLNRPPQISIQYLIR
jgi:hypothetical protein